jgi:hypothetical protein
MRIVLVGKVMQELARDNRRSQGDDAFATANSRELFSVVEVQAAVHIRVANNDLFWHGYATKA